LNNGVVLSLARMNRILSVDAAERFAVVEPGVVNLKLQEELSRSGHYYAPDPASFRVSTIGGNIAENAGGPRCLKYGVTTDHVRAVEAVMPDGSLERFSSEDAGPELMSLLVGSEGTLGVVVKAWLDILPLPQAVRAILAGFSSVEAAVECVSSIIAAGILPRALEAMDRATVESVEAYRPAGYPACEAVLLIELDGAPDAVAREAGAIERLCREHHAEEIRSAAEEAERERLWEGRRGAYAACARMAPNVLVEDGVVPRQKLGEIVRRIREIAVRRRVKTSLVFHAGDGNIHPNIPYDERNAEEALRVRMAGLEMLEACVELGGSLSGEHGVGIQKREAMHRLHTPRALMLLRDLKKAMDPEDLANPGKMFPADGSVREKMILPSRPLSPRTESLRDVVRRCAAQVKPMAIVGSGSRWKAAAPGCVELSTSGMDAVLDLDKGNYTVTVEAGAAVDSLRRALSAQGFHLRLPDCGGTLGGVLASKACPALRGDVLGMRLKLSSVSREIPMAGKPKPFLAGPWQRCVKEAFDPKNLFNPWFFAGDNS
jgi:glycolate oxidase subunit GlcD